MQGSWKGTLCGRVRPDCNRIVVDSAAVVGAGSRADHQGGVFLAGHRRALRAADLHVLSAVLGIIIFVDDYSILSSTGAQCNHLRHVSTQLPYATLVMAVCFVGYLLAGFTMSPWPSLVIGLAVLAVAVPVLGKRAASRQER